MATYRMTVEFTVDSNGVVKAQEQAQKVADLLNKHPGRKAIVTKAIKKFYSEEDMTWKK